MPDLSLHGVFDAVVTRSPERTALIAGPDRIGYAELRRRADALAVRLTRLGIRPEDRVAVHLERSVELIVAMLGVLKAGAAFVPVAPEYPRERIDFMLRDSGAVAVVTEPGTAPPGDVPVVPVAGATAAEEEPLAPVAVPADAAAYVIYTSGSTGRPKGVVVTHANALGLVQGQDYVRFGPQETFLQLSPTSFDASAFEIWGALLHGSTLVLPGTTYQAVEALPEVVREHGVSTLFLTPALFHELVRGKVEVFDGVRQVVVGGDVLSPSRAGEFLRHAAGQDRRAVLVNGYGPTETTTFATARSVTPDDASGDRLPIGRPLAGVRVYVLDEELRPVPDGEQGQLFVAGSGVTRGYAGRPGATAAAFLPDPWGDAPGARMYRTGDLGRLRPDGAVEYLGRTDDQVKVRGFRIEPKEVELALLGLPDVREAAVVAEEHADGGKQLVAYVVADEDAGRDPARLRAALGERLPAHLVPSRVVFTAELGLGPSGKLDRRALTGRKPVPDPAGAGARDTPDALQAQDAPDTRDAPDRLDAPDPLDTPASSDAPDRLDTPASSDAQAERGGEVPAGRNQAILAEVWAKVLGVPRVGPDDDFFALGGDSMLAIRAVADAEELGVTVSLGAMFHNPVLREVCPPDTEPVPVDWAEEPVPQAEHPGDAPSSGGPAALPEGAEASYPATRLQLGLIFEAVASADQSLYHDVMAHRVGARLDEAALRTALDRTARTHEVLRTRFDIGAEGGPHQVVESAPALPLTAVDLRGLDEEAFERELERLAAEAGRPFDVERAPLMRVYAAARDEDCFWLVYGFHHAIMDGWSDTVFLTDLMDAYARALAGEDPAPRRPALRYEEFVRLEERARESAETRAFWRARTADLRPTLLARPGVAPSAGRLRIARSVPAGLREALTAVSARLRVPLKSLVVAAHLAVVGELGGTERPVAGLPVNGRPEAAGADRLVGLFLNILPVSARLTGATWEDLTRQAFDAERGALEHRRFPLQEIRDQAGGPLFDVILNFAHFHLWAGLSDGGTGGPHRPGDPGGAGGRIRVDGTRMWDKTSYPLVVDVVLDAVDDDLRIDVTGDTGQWDEAALERVWAMHRDALAALAADPSRPVA
ncbi:amino acid adenylation domain-containing protein [Streptomyces sp. NPDC056632]|uniref:amino acid adenylation domain-containing protein n=1 Tax=Streptomyces sp. NPDC056632 TaxID=3345884 RepID=UPI003693A3BB